MARPSDRTPAQTSDASVGGAERLRSASALGRALDRILTWAARVARTTVVLGGGIILISAFLISADVILRRVFGVSTWGADELSRYALAIASSWAFAYAMLVKAHIRIDALVNQLARPIRAAADVIALAAMGFTALLFSQAALAVFARSWERGTTSITTLATPLWIPQGLWLAGFLVFTVITFLLLVRVLVALLVERSYEIANHYGGPPTVEEETAEASAQAEAALAKGR